jgi:hypothetical protein
VLRIVTTHPDAPLLKVARGSHDPIPLSIPLRLSFSAPC